MRYSFEGDPLVWESFAAALPAWWDHAPREEAEVCFLVRCKRIIPESELALAGPKVWINLHLGRLPDYRGVRPISRAMLNGDEKITVTWHLVDRGVDTGNILWDDDILIGNLNAADLYRRALSVGRARLAYEAHHLTEFPKGRLQYGRPVSVTKALWDRAMAWEEVR